MARLNAFFLRVDASLGLGEDALWVIPLMVVAAAAGAIAGFAIVSAWVR